LVLVSAINTQFCVPFVLLFSLSLLLQRFIPAT